MCMTLHAIGYPCPADCRTSAMIVSAALASRRRVTTPRGEYRIWRSSAGAEIWLHYPLPKPATDGPGGPGRLRGHVPPAFDPLGDLMGMTLVHAGASTIRMRLAKSLGVSPTNPLEGVGIALLASQRMREKPIAFTFELLGYGSDDVRPTGEMDVQITALAQKIWAYASERDYFAATPAKRLIGPGAMANVTATEVPEVPLIYRPKPGTLWLATGTVRRAIRLINPETSSPYYLIHLATDRGLIDVVANPEVIEGDISEGHIAQILVTVTGRILQRV